MKITVLLEALTGSFDTDIDRSSRKAEKRLRQMEQEFTKTFKQVAVAGAAAAAGVALITKQQIDLADRMAKLAQTTGMSVEQLSSLELAAELAGVSLDEMATGMGRLARTASDATRGLKTAQDAFSAVGISVTDESGNLRSLDDLLGDVADAFSKMEDGTAKAAVAQELFGRAGAKMIPLLNQGRAGLAAAREEAEALGLVLDADTAAAAERFNDNLTRVEFAAKGAARELAEGLLPHLDFLSEQLVTAAKDGDSFVETGDNIGEAIRVIAGAAVGAWASIKALGIGFVSLATAAEALLRFDTDGAMQAIDQANQDLNDIFDDASKRILDLRTGEATPVAASAPRTQAIVRENTTTGKTEAEKAAEAHAKALEKVREQVLLLNDAEGEAAKMRAMVDELYAQGKVPQAAYLAFLEESAQALDEQGQAAEDNADSMAVLADQAARNIQSFTASMVDAALAGENLGDVVVAALRRIAAEILVMAALRALGEGLQNSGSTFWAGVGKTILGARADGGPVTGGGAYLVGEKGPELFVPKTSGTIIPNGGGAGVSVTNYNDFSNADAESIPRLQAAMEVTRRQTLQDVAHMINRGGFEQ